MPSTLCCPEPGWSLAVEHARLLREEADKLLNDRLNRCGEHGRRSMAFLAACTVSLRCGEIDGWIHNPISIVSIAHDGRALVDVGHVTTDLTIVGYTKTEDDDTLDWWFQRAELRYSGRIKKVRQLDPDGWWPIGTLAALAQFEAEWEQQVARAAL